MRVDRREFIKRSFAGSALIAAGTGFYKQNAFAMNKTMFQTSSDVSFVGSSAAGTRRQMITDVLAPWKYSVAAGISGKTILVKVNMVYWNPALEDPSLSLTHVDAVRGLLDFLRSISATVPIIVGDCTANNSQLGNIATMFTDAGYTDLENEYSGVTLRDLNTFAAAHRKFWDPDFTAAAPVAIPIISAFTDPSYFVISITRPKTHSNTVFTGVNKNILMGAPLHSYPALENSSSDSDPLLPTVIPKQFMHGQNGWYSGTNPGENQCLSYNLYQMANLIYSTGAPALSVLDAWEGMEGDGPVSGTGVAQYCAVAGVDPLAVDRLTAKLIGLSDTATDPMDKTMPSFSDSRYLVWISNAGFGNYDLSRINFILGSLAELETYVKQYALSPNYTGDPSYETQWQPDVPPVVLDLKEVKVSHTLDPKPYLVPQLHKQVTSNEIAINFSLPVVYKIDLAIYTLSGVEIRTFGIDHLPGGRYSVVWNCCDNRGSRVSAGNYIIRLGFGSRFLCDNITLVK